MRLLVVMTPRVGRRSPGHHRGLAGHHHRDHLAGRGWRVTPPGPLRDDLGPETADWALGRGQISLEHVRAIRGARRVLGEDYAGIEATVAGIAAQHTAADLRTILERSSSSTVRRSTTIWPSTTGPAAGWIIPGAGQHLDPQRAAGRRHR